MDEHWHLTLIEQAQPRGSKFTQGRSIDAVDVDRVSAAGAMLATVRGQTLIGPLVRARDRLSRVVSHVLANPSIHANDPDVRTDWAMALDEWLVHLAMCRRRTEREVESVLGSEAGDHAKSTFSRLYGEHDSFRFAWEWRNEAQHHMNPLNISKVNAHAATPNGHELRWQLDPAQASRLGRGWSHGSMRLLAEGRDCLAIVDDALRGCEQAIAEILVHNEERIGEGADLVLSLCRELLETVTDETQMPISYALTSLERKADGGSADRDNAHLMIAMHVLRFDHATAAMLAVNGGRQVLGLPARFEL
ncbi:hypothetical protein [Xylanimonas protaetiae]|uniref:Uncharacterized protein n=1 Tax=Xylanimonas protaetiae TaxID=2509457 RepID=A0A4P6F8W0_9MICO|nr:hypothetical protein [Xylanimonas protaetiae]QAY69747.1 hypothetical protein ET471_06575 [Xylanimonas protaetiae]